MYRYYETECLIYKEAVMGTSCKKVVKLNFFQLKFVKLNFKLNYLKKISSTKLK